jgi:hypothetical protein
MVPLEVKFRKRRNPPHKAGMAGEFAICKILYSVYI